HSSPSLDDLLEITAPIVSQISTETGETVHVWVPDGPYVRLIYGARGSSPDAVPHDKWSHVPAYSTAGGRTMLATLPNSYVDEIHREGLLPWRVSPIVSLKDLKRRLTVVRRRGYDTNVEEGAQGVSGLAFAVSDPLQRPVLALGIALPVVRFVPPLLTRCREALEPAHARIQRALY